MAIDFFPDTFLLLNIYHLKDFEIGINLTEWGAII